MPKTVLKQHHLTDDKLQPKGTYLAVELTDDYTQEGCKLVPKGTRGIIAGQNGYGGHIFLFPHNTIQEDPPAFRDGNVRIVSKGQFKALGRINHK